MEFNVIINCDNAAFEGDELADAIAKALRWVANRAEHDGLLSGVIRDRNGNSVGCFGLRGAVLE